MAAAIIFPAADISATEPEYMIEWNYEQGQVARMTTMPRSNFPGLVLGALLALTAAANAQDAARLAAGEAAWDKAGCLQCHGSAGEGGAGGEFPAGPSLRTSRLDPATFAETIRCGRPSSQMPAWLEGAYTEVSCYGLPHGPPPPGLELTPVLSAGEIAALIDYLMAKIVGK